MLKSPQAIPSSSAFYGHHLRAKCGTDARTCKAIRTRCHGVMLFLRLFCSLCKTQINSLHTNRQIVMVFCILSLSIPPHSCSFLLDTESLPFRAVGTVLNVAARNNILHRSRCTFCTAIGLAPTCQLTVEGHAFHVELHVRFWSMSSVVSPTTSVVGPAMEWCRHSLATLPSLCFWAAHGSTVE